MMTENKSPRSVQPLKWHGGKHYLAAKLIAIADQIPHICWVETHGGGLTVTLAKNPAGISEIVNDIDHGLTNFWRVLQSEEAYQIFRRYIEAVPFSEREWTDWKRVWRDGDDLDPIEAAGFFILSRQSLAGRMACFTPVTIRRTRRGMNEQVSAWLNAVEGLPAVHERLQRILILDQDAAEVIAKHDGPGTLFYCDPPYLQTTRASHEIYRHEMTLQHHEALLQQLANIEGHFLLSGYPSELYEAYAKTQGWRRETFELPNNAAGGKTKRRMTECVWTNSKAIF